MFSGKSPVLDSIIAVQTKGGVVRSAQWIDVYICTLIGLQVACRHEFTESKDATLPVGFSWLVFFHLGAFTVFSLFLSV